MVRELFSMARVKKSCVIFFDEIDAIGGARYHDGTGGDNEVHRTMLELINQLDGFDACGNIKVRISNTLIYTIGQVLHFPPCSLYAFKCNCIIIYTEWNIFEKVMHPMSGKWNFMKKINYCAVLLMIQ